MRQSNKFRNRRRPSALKQDAFSALRVLLGGHGGFRNTPSTLDRKMGSARRLRAGAVFAIASCV
jgi:hypothetical protein